jgi:hypothetical protein
MGLALLDPSYGLTAPEAALPHAVNPHAEQIKTANRKGRESQRIEKTEPDLAAANSGLLIHEKISRWFSNGAA